jgi:hypothetical protein
VARRHEFIDERPIGRRKFLPCLPGELREILQSGAERDRVERFACLHQAVALKKVVRDTAEADSARSLLQLEGPRLHLREAGRTTAGCPVAQPLVPDGQVLTDIGDEARAFPPRRKSGPPETQRVAHSERLAHETPGDPRS